MKKIGKAELKNATVLNESEMKNVVGGNDLGYCPIFCSDGTIIEADTCRGAAGWCAGSRIGWCSGTAERCFSDFDGSFDNQDDLNSYYGL